MNFAADVAASGPVALVQAARPGHDRALSAAEWVQVFDACLASIRATEQHD